MNGDDNIWTDEQLTALFARASGDATPPDEDLLIRLRDESAKAFAASGINPPPIQHGVRLEISIIDFSVCVRAYLGVAGQARLQ